MRRVLFPALLGMTLTSPSLAQRPPSVNSNRAEEHCRAYALFQVVDAQVFGPQRETLRQGYLLECQRHFDRTRTLIPFPPVPPRASR